MSLRHLKFLTPAVCLAVLALPIYAQQDAPPPAAAAPADAAPAPPAPPVAATAKKPAGPDYPDPRTFVVGISYWLTIPGSGPNVASGHPTATPGTVDGLGGDHGTPGVEISFPVTRTGVLHFESFLSKGDGSQLAPQDTTPFVTSFTRGEYLATQYQITAAKVYLEDLLYPFKFPVARFRLKSLWEFQYIQINSTIDAPLAPITQDSAGNVISTTGTGNRNILFPTFGLAAEYDLAPHLMLRVAASGFGLYHRADIWDADATVSYRRNSLEFVGGFKALHFKTSPQKDYFVSDNLDGGFFGLRWHF